MKNAVLREIPEEILKITGKEPFRGNHYMDGKEIEHTGVKVRAHMNNTESKLVKDIHEALVKCNAHDGMTVSFHHHFREGDLIVNMVMEEIHKMRPGAVMDLYIYRRNYDDIQHGIRRE